MKKWRNKLNLFVIVLVFTVSTTTGNSALALDPVTSNLIKSGVSRYNDQLYCASNVSVGSINDNASQTDRLKYIYRWMRSKGLNPVQSAAVVGNVSQESGGNPRASQNPRQDISDPMQIPTQQQAKGAAESNSVVGVGRAWGLIQWDHGARALYYQKQSGVSGDISKMETQLEIIYWHMTNISPTSSKNMLEGFKDFDTESELEAAVGYYEKKMTGAGKPALMNRIAAAQIAITYESEVQAEDPDTEAGDGSEPAIVTSVSDASNSDCSNTTSQHNGAGVPAGFVQAVEQYTWPYEWRTGASPDGAALSPVTLTPAYAAAINRAKADKRWVGNNGVDCGGFVTTLAYDSKLDTEYNGDGYNGNTAIQLRYLRSSGNWEKLPSNLPASEYKPGDVGIYRTGDPGLTGATGSGHTVIYVGDIPSFWSVDTRNNQPIPPNKLDSVPKDKQRRVLLASASNGKRAPMADKDDRVGNTKYEWFRKK